MDKTQEEKMHEDFRNWLLDFESDNDCKPKLFDAWCAFQSENAELKRKLAAYELDGLKYGETVDEHLDSLLQQAREEERERCLPDEPTPEMLEAGAEMFRATLHSAADFKHHAYHVYYAMAEAIHKGDKP